MTTKTEKNYSLEKYHTNEFTITELLKDMTAAQVHKDTEKEAKNKYSTDSASLSAKFMTLSKIASSLEDFELMCKECRKRIKSGDISTTDKQVPQAFYDASSICRKGWKLGTLAKASSVEGLKKANTEALRVESAKNPASLDDFMHLLRDAYKAASGEDDKVESPAQTAMLADLKALTDKYAVAVAKATDGAKPVPAKGKQARKAASK